MVSNIDTTTDSDIGTKGRTGQTKFAGEGSHTGTTFIGRYIELSVRGLEQITMPKFSQAALPDIE